MYDGCPRIKCTLAVCCLYIIEHFEIIDIYIVLIIISTMKALYNYIHERNIPFVCMYEFSVIYKQFPDIHI